MNEAREPGKVFATTQAPFGCTAPQVLFLNFDGALLRGAPGCEDARQNCSTLVWENLGTTTLAYPAYTGTLTQRQQTIDLVKRFFAPFNLQVVTSRPAKGLYSMVMIGGGPTLLSQGTNIRGKAPLDCGNTDESNIAFAFADAMNNDPAHVASAAAQEAAHAYGLSHVQNTTDVMYPINNGLANGFHDEVMPAPDCPGCCASSQNDVELLNVYIGPACAGAGSVGTVAWSDGLTDAGAGPGGGVTGNSQEGEARLASLPNLEGTSASTGTASATRAGGCSVAPAAQGAERSAVALAVFLLLAFGVGRLR